MIYQDDQNNEQLASHTILVTATDKFMSGWGRASEGLSKCAWACRTETEAQRLFDWVRSRPEMKYVNIHRGRQWRPRNAPMSISTLPMITIRHCDRAR